MDNHVVLANNSVAFLNGNWEVEPVLKYHSKGSHMESPYRNATPSKQWQWAATWSEAGTIQQQQCNVPPWQSKQNRQYNAIQLEVK
jgi:hypothetical protein